ncbi:chromosome segregation protein SMC [Rhizobium leguminosarum bv. viciae]|nr:chromosome segregation protein SMC [Rhizobium leguminosarum]TAW70113.1 chromosome segregation protein SMC [Rhizobium ruizarguesonis]TBY23243.1 chromosome segregation protein SMC [Rhizobium leguminosarum bv. viciae]MBY5481269.1 chromosome segregation protein SMC [Rhizobium leguminosarum]MBY5848028.1 chromosome segregation protein SMC [Rhizobium leguminosarum]
MFELPKFSLTVPAGLKEPRLWVRRLVIWEAPGGKIVRDIGLRPGLNIIWSPDGVDEEGAVASARAIGHGSGKTLFCRLLRYCLGEQRFADETQRESIAIALPNGIVGAEVMIDGVCWAVVRPLGIRRRHVAIAGGNLEEIAAGDEATTSIDPLIEAIEQGIVTPGVANLARLPPGQKAWPIALAWLTRDQECRFDDVLDWRSPASGSDAPLPASGRETGPRREALRAFLMAITEEEQQSRRTEEVLRTDVASAEREISNLEWDIGRRQKRLTDKLDLTALTLPEMPLLLHVLQKYADERLAAAAQLPTGDMAELGQARKLVRKASDELRHTEDEHNRIEAQIPGEKQVLTLISSEIPALSFSAENAASQVCPICEVPIDKALAEKCKLSHKLHNETECRARLASKRQEIEEQKQKISGLELRLKTLQPSIALGRQRVDQAEKQVQAIENVRDARAAAWQAATGLKEGVERFVELSVEKDESRKRLRVLEEKLSKEREILAAFLEKQGLTFGIISRKFSAIIRRFVSDNSKGALTLTGKGLKLIVDIDGDRRTAAIDSLKVLAFDLACLCLSVEGSTRVPAFVVHDSPREADLGLSIYDELFQLMRELEEFTETPVFQYIVTTTTRPPNNLRRDPWLRLILRGAPGSERLLQRDL